MAVEAGQLSTVRRLNATAFAFLTIHAAVLAAHAASGADAGAPGLETRLNTAVSADVLWFDAATSENGYGVAAWSEFNGGLFQAFASRFVPGEGWADAHQVGLGVINESFPQVAQGADGTALVSWNTFDSGSRGAYVAVFSPITGWLPPFRLDTTGATIRPTVAAGPDGTGLVVWPEQVGGNTSVFARSYSPQTGWSVATQISNPPSRAVFVAISADVNGSTWVAWSDSLGDNRILACSYSPTAGWGAQVLLSTAQSGYSYLVPSVAVMPKGNEAIVAWTQSYNSTAAYRAQAAIFRASSGWAAPVYLSTNTTAQRSFPRVEAGNGASLGAVYLDQVAGVEDLYAKGVNSTGFWGLATRLSNSRPIQGTDLAASEFGGVVAAWIEPTTGRDTLKASRFTDGEGWGPPSIVAPDASGNATDLVLSLDRDGNCLLVWSEWRQGHLGLFSTLVTERVPPPLSLVAPLDGTLVLEASVMVTGMTEPGAKVTANGVSAEVRTNGSFSVLVPVAAGNNTVTVVAQDKEGNTAAVAVRVAFDDPLPALEQRLNQTNAALAEARTDLANASWNISVLQAALVTTENELTAARSQLNDSETRLARLEANATASNSDLETARESLNSTLANLSQISAKVNQSEAALAAAQVSLDEMNMRIAGLESDRTRLEVLVNDSTANNDASQQQAEGLHEILSRTEAFVAASFGVGAVGALIGAIALVKLRRLKGIQGAEGENARRGPRPPPDV